MGLVRAVVIAPATALKKFLDAVCSVEMPIRADFADRSRNSGVASWYALSFPADSKGA
jgi:hypothetical protein